MTGTHRGVAAPWLARLRCWVWGCDIEQTGIRAWHCIRCDRCGPSPVELT